MTRRLLFLCAMFSACAANAPSQQQERYSADPRAEIARLEGRIGSLMRSRLSAAPSEEAPPLEQPVAPVVIPEEPRPAPPPPSPTVSAPAERPSRPERRSSRCSRMDEAAGEICDAADRICRLAGEIGDGDSSRSCSRAQRDCQRSRDIASSCH